MNKGQFNGNFIEKLKKLKKFKLLISIGGPCLLVLFVILILFLSTSSSISGLMPVLTSSSMSGVKTIYDGSDLVNNLASNFDLWEYDNTNHRYSDELPDDNNFFQELKRQRKIWVDDYYQYGLTDPKSNIPNYQNNDIDLVKIIVPIHYQGNINLLSYGQEFDEENDNLVIDDKGTLLSEYQGERNVYNRDTRDFLEKAKSYIGSTILIYPDKREMAGHLISTKVTFSVVTYNGNNTNEILSDWELLSKILSKNEIDINNSSHDASTATSKFNNALTEAYNLCHSELSDNLDDWRRKNYCYDYDLIFKEFNLKQPTSQNGTVVINLQQLINETLSSSLNPVIPIGQLTVGNYYITIHIEKDDDEKLYEDFIKKVYIPYLYLDCENCGYRNSSDSERENRIEQIYNEILSYETAFRYVNDGRIDSGDAPNKTGGGNHDVPNVEYSCSGGKLPNLATYPGHGGIDINGVPTGTSVYPLFPGTVYSISRDNANCPPRLNAQGGYTCKHCSGTGYGNLVIIKGTAADGKEYLAYYGHLNDIYVSVGQQVDVTTKIGAVGNTGCSTGAHLHLELRKTSDGSKVFANTIYNNTSIASVLCSRTTKEV